jgi:hypothetical protein
MAPTPFTLLHYAPPYSTFLHLPPLKADFLLFFAQQGLSRSPDVAADFWAQEKGRWFTTALSPLLSTRLPPNDS